MSKKYTEEAEEPLASLVGAMRLSSASFFLPLSYIIPIAVAGIDAVYVAAIQIICGKILVACRIAQNQMVDKPIKYGCVNRIRI